MASPTLYMSQYTTHGHKPHSTHVPFLGASCLPSPTTCRHHPPSFPFFRNNSGFPGTNHPSLTVCSASVAVSNEGTAAGESGSPYSLQFRWGVGAEQGPRDTMEDVTQVVTDGCCGFLYAST